MLPRSIPWEGAISTKRPSRLSPKVEFESGGKKDKSRNDKRNNYSTLASYTPQHKSLDINNTFSKKKESSPVASPKATLKISQIL